MKRLSIVLTLGLLILAAPFTYGAAHTRLVRSCPNGVTCAYASGLNGYVLVGNGVDFDYQLFAGLPAGLTIGTSTITSGADTRVLFQDGTVVAENANLTFVKGTGTLHATLMTATTFTGALSGNATTATALAANGANCSAGNYPLGVNASGAVESCTAEFRLSAAVDDTIPIANGATFDLKSLPNCLDTSGNHLNYTASTNTLSCGTSGSGAASLTVGTSTLTSGTNTRVLFDDSGVLNESAGLTYVKGTGTLTATAFSGPLTGNVTGNVTGALTGNASTATALAANGTNCSAASFPLGVDASGNAESCTALSASNAGTATALAANGANCSAGSFPLGVDASGAAESCTTVSSLAPDLSGLAFVTVGNTSSLSAERAITAGNNVALTDGGANSTITIADGTNAVAFTNAITPTQIAANTDDYNPTGLSTAYTLRLSTDASRNLTGISASGAGAVEGRQLVIQNVGSNPLVLKNLTTSSAANQFANGGKDLTIPTGGSVAMQYDGTATKWRVFSPKVKITGSGSEPSECSDDQIQSVSDGTNNQCVTLGAGAHSGQTAVSGSVEFGVQQYNKANNTFSQKEITEDIVYGAVKEQCSYSADGSASIFSSGSDNTGFTCSSTGTSPVRAESDPLAGTNEHFESQQTKVSSPTSGDTAGISAGSGAQHKAVYNPRYEVKIRTDSSLANTRLYFGFNNNTAPSFTPSTSAFTGIAGAWVIYDSAVSSGTWLLCTGESTTANKAQCFDTSITAAVSTSYWISLYTPDHGVTYICNINGSEFSTTTHVPVTTTALSSVNALVMTLTSAQKLFYLDRMVIRTYH